MTVLELLKKLEGKPLDSEVVIYSRNALARCHYAEQTKEMVLAIRDKQCRVIVLEGGDAR